jgi:hypothetical protein
MNIVITKISVVIYVRPIIIGTSIVLIARKASRPIPGQLKTISIRSEPVIEPDSANADDRNVGGAAFFSACEYVILLSDIPCALLAAMKSSWKTLIT